jgi:hypothetical protein
MTEEKLERFVVAKTSKYYKLSHSTFTLQEIQETIMKSEQQVHFSFGNFLHFLIQHVLFFFLPFPLSTIPLLIVSLCKYKAVRNMSFLPRIDTPFFFL